MMNKKWYIVTKYWIKENDVYFSINHWTGVGNKKDYSDINGATHVEEIDPDAKDMGNLANKFTVEAKPFLNCAKFAYTGNLNECLRFVRGLKNRIDWKDWKWRNWKYEGVDMEVEEK